MEVVLLDCIGRGGPRRLSPGTTQAGRRATTDSAIRPTRRRSRRSSASCALAATAPMAIDYAA